MSPTTSECLAPGAGAALECPDEKQRQIGHRLTQDFVHRTLDDFNAGAPDASEAASRLGVSRSHLFRLRHRHLNGKPVTALSGGNHLQLWPEAVQAVLAAFLARPEAPNFQLIANPIASRHDFTRHRSSVAAHARAHHPGLLHQHAPKPSPRRRWERARIGEIRHHLERLRALPRRLPQHGPSHGPLHRWLVPLRPRVHG